MNPLSPSALNIRPVRLDADPKPIFFDSAMTGKVFHQERDNETLTLTARVQITAGENIRPSDYLIENEGYTRSKPGFSAEGRLIGRHSPQAWPEKITEKGTLDFTNLSIDGIKEANTSQLQDQDVVMENRYSTTIIRMPPDE